MKAKLIQVPAFSPDSSLLLVEVRSVVGGHPGCSASLVEDVGALVSFYVSQHGSSDAAGHLMLVPPDVLKSSGFSAWFSRYLREFSPLTRKEESCAEH
jgi:hypothetical protein